MMFLLSFVSGLLWFAVGNIFQIMIRDGATALGGFAFCIALLVCVASSLCLGALARG